MERVTAEFSIKKSGESVRFRSVHGLFRNGECEGEGMGEGNVQDDHQDDHQGDDHHDDHLFCLFLFSGTEAFSWAFDDFHCCCCCCYCCCLNYCCYFYDEGDDGDRGGSIHQ